MLALMASIDGQASEQDDRYRLVGCKTQHKPRRRFAGHNRTRRECVVAGDIRSVSVVTNTHEPLLRWL
jgi:hypothetical protein